ncbi:MAG TPA: prenyltransferase/squalene oxidase repeat-containing protein [Tepidisphaeraceae bacterium]|nr:prenyltransferase/squalene oxidase repeat-containing protein [Tepidisphaeraceae bacterium]
MKFLRATVLIAAVGAVSAFSSARPVFSADAPAAKEAGQSMNDPAALAQSEIDKALAFLKGQQQPDGSWQKEGEPPALTAIALRGFVGDPKSADQPFVQKGFDKLLTFQKDDGSISSDILATYNTAIATSAFAKTNNPKYKPAVDKAVAYLRSIQWTDKIEGVKDQNKKVDPNDPNYGGWGYGHGKGRADLSNAQMAIEALHDAGLKPGDPAFDAALKFVTRTQNNSETNDQKWASDDGGFVYFPGNGGGSETGDEVGPNGQRIVRSYGSMTYAGIKSMIYCGLSQNDPRVKAAFNWVRKNWTMDINPGMQFSDPTGKNPKAAESGLYYYYHTLARALRAYGDPQVTDAKGAVHDWRVELLEHLAKQQNADGSFQGTQRWMENRPNLSTAFAVLAAEEALADLKEHPVKK